MKKFLSIFLCVLLLISGSAVCLAEPAEDAPLLDGATLVTFGASNTALSTWPREVATELNMELVNSGIGGNNTTHARARFERDVISHDPDFVILCFGVNDLNRLVGSPPVTLEEYRDNFQYFIDETKAIGAVPILVTSPFISESACGRSSCIRRLCQRCFGYICGGHRELAEENGVGLVDIHQVCDDNYTVEEFLIKDGIHLSELGDSVFTEEICRYMKANFRQDPDAPRVKQPTAPRRSLEYGQRALPRLILTNG